MKLYAILALPIVILLGAFLAWLFNGSFSYAMLVYAVGIYAGIPALLILLIFLAVQWGKKRQVTLECRVAALTLAIVLASLGISLKMGKWLHEKAIENTRKYVSSVMPELREYYAKNDQYPPTLSALEELRSQCPL